MDAVTTSETVGGLLPPRPAFVLPGRWWEVPLWDPLRAEALADHLRSRLSDVGAGSLESTLEPLMGHWRALSSRGQAVLYLSQDDDLPVFVTMLWPRILPSPAQFAGGTPALEALRSLAESGSDDGLTTLDHRSGYPALRGIEERQGESIESTSITYWMSHPVSARMMLIDVRLWGTDREELVDLFDAMASSLTWDDRDPLT